MFRIPAYDPVAIAVGYAPALSVGSLGITLTAVRRRVAEKDECQGVAGL
jgi:hypothetical protein